MSKKKKAARRNWAGVVNSIKLGTKRVLAILTPCKKKRRISTDKENGTEVISNDASSGDIPKTRSFETCSCPDDDFFLMPGPSITCGFGYLPADACLHFGLFFTGTKLSPSKSSSLNRFWSDFMPRLLNEFLLSQKSTDPRVFDDDSIHILRLPGMDGSNKTLLVSDDLCNELMEYLKILGSSKDKHGRVSGISAAHVQAWLAQPEIMQKYGITKQISLSTATCHLHALGFRFASPVKGQYVDGHERPDVYTECDNLYIPRRSSLCLRMQVFNKDGNDITADIEAMVASGNLVS
ncbi:hypothetical protein B0H19DRAFT_1057015 [Mycena capillaripes]|nr:hypothetical protein B0H19DRAFT_1057015 [Mycena capillaripes]